MEFINKLRLKIEGLERKDFYKYLIIVLVVMVTVMGFFLFRYYSNVWSLRDRLEDINETREVTVKSILKRMNKVEQQRKHVNDVLAKEKDFKISWYFNDLLKKQNLLDKKMTERSSEVTLSNNYTELILTAQLSGMNMRELCELLEKIEKNERVYAKSLEIIRSTKAPKTIEVNVTIATLQPKLKAGK